ncbi:MAG: hypothetical protein K0R00_178 [Herbinix sp.]|jgi:hypothetical protein|nr:hypothetical protein [Herbinix sp.]
MSVLEITRNTTSSDDEILSGATLQQIYSVYTIIDEDALNYHFYYKDADYNVINSKYIRWTGTNKPVPGTTYCVECYYIQPDIAEYESDDCPRCLGNGWYVDLMPQSETNITTITGSNKIVQDFIKMIFTYQVEGSSYGTKISDYAGKAVYDINQTCSEVASIFYVAANYYKELQMSSILDGNQLTDDEILESIIINSIEYDEGTGSIYAEVSLRSRSGLESEVGIGI